MSLHVYSLYPHELGELVSHAARLAEILEAHELTPPGDARASRWATGRADEIARFMENVTSEWRAGTIAEHVAGARISSYLRELHQGLREHFGAHAARCCPDAQRDAAGSATTEAAVTRELASRTVRTTVDVTVSDADTDADTTEMVAFGGGLEPRRAAH
jgi:hypothetical protein